MLNRPAIIIALANPRWRCHRRHVRVKPSLLCGEGTRKAQKPGPCGMIIQGCCIVRRPSAAASTAAAALRPPIKQRQFAEQHHHEQRHLGLLRQHGASSAARSDPLPDDISVTFTNTSGVTLLWRKDQDGGKFSATSRRVNPSRSPEHQKSAAVGFRASVPDGVGVCGLSLSTAWFSL